MKKSKKLLLLIPAMGLFLTGCTLQEIIGSVKDFFTFTKEEKASEKDEKTTPSGDNTQPSQDTHTVNALWPATEIASFLAQYDISDVVPGYTGEAKSIVFTSSDQEIAIEVPDGSTEASVLSTYVADLTRANYIKGPQYQGYDTYNSPEGNIGLLPYKGSDAGESGYVFIMIGNASSTDVSTAAGVIDDIAETLSYLTSSTITGMHDDGDYIVVNFGDETIANLKSAVENYLVPDGFTAESTTWASSTFTDNTPFEYKYYTSDTVRVRFSVYNESSYEDDDYNGNMLQIEAWDLAD